MAQKMTRVAGGWRKVGHYHSPRTKARCGNNDPQPGRSSDVFNRLFCFVFLLLSAFPLSFTDALIEKVRASWHYFSLSFRKKAKRIKVLFLVLTQSLG